MKLHMHKIYLRECTYYIEHEALIVRWQICRFYIKSNVKLNKIWDTHLTLCMVQVDCHCAQQFVIEPYGENQKTRYARKHCQTSKQLSILICVHTCLLT